MGVGYQLTSTLFQYKDHRSILHVVNVLVWKMKNNFLPHWTRPDVYTTLHYIFMIKTHPTKKIMSISVYRFSNFLLHFAVLHLITILLNVIENSSKVLEQICQIMVYDRFVCLRLCPVILRMIRNLLTSKYVWKIK